jgi:hypothetical protein
MALEAKKCITVDGEGWGAVHDDDNKEHRRFFFFVETQTHTHFFIGLFISLVVQ